ncbi:Metacaspase-1 [Lachnellula suecica]|uniref:Metacaspase-1 n=1 Tax=Lachnellula suecica TaxID=602035 RepID=A0A8T9CD48_9HELO|nr:Metacaspase-1 [Lachnellula suecica]
MPRRKALLIGINYTGSKHALNGCQNDSLNMKQYLVEERGFSSARHDMVVMTDTPENAGTPFEPTGENIMAVSLSPYRHSPREELLTMLRGRHSIGWFLATILVTPYGCLTQATEVKDPDGDRESGFDDTICPVDFEKNGQIDSDTLHKTLVSPLNPAARLTILFDCCHSGSAVELPYVYRPDGDGQVNLVDNVKQGINLATAAYNLVQGGFSAAKINDAKALIGGARSFFHSLHHRPAEDLTEDGLAEDHFVEDWKNEGKDVWMFSGCADNQTSADTSIAGAPTGAMSYGFIKTMKENPQQSYIQVLQNTRTLLARHYQQIPQLSCGGKYDLDQVVAI